MLDTVVFSDDKGITFFTDTMMLVKINAEEDTLLRDRFKIMGYPTAVMIDSEGQEVDRIVGFAETEEYLQILQDYAQGIGTLDDLLSKFAQNPDRDTAFIIADKYKYRGGADEAAEWYRRVIDMGGPTDSLSGESRLSLADVYRRGEEYERALTAFESVMEDFTGTFFGETAEIYRAIVYRQKGDTATAIEAFEQFVVNNPDSEDVEYAQGQIRKLKGEVTN